MQFKKRQLSIPVMIEKNNIVDAEIRWCLQVVQSKYSQRSCNGIVELFTVMFPGSDIAKKMTLKKGKCGYMINYGIAPHLEKLLLSEIKSSPFYSLSFDESLNSKLQKGQMDILVRFWNNDTMMAETRYLVSQFMGGAKADDIMKTFDDAVTKKIGQADNLLQISSDGPNVNLLFL